MHTPETSDFGGLHKNELRVPFQKVESKTFCESKKTLAFW